jgi:ribosomal protein S19
MTLINILQLSLRGLERYRSRLQGQTITTESRANFILPQRISKSFEIFELTQH